MSKEASFSLNLKSDSGYDNAMLTIRGDTIEEFKANVEDAVADMLQLVTEASELFHKTHSVVTTGEKPKKDKKNKDKGEEQTDNVRSIDSGKGDEDVRTCSHGKRNFREGKGRTGPWAAYFCSERNKRDQCEPDWVDLDD